MGKKKSSKSTKPKTKWLALRRDVLDCSQCERLIQHCRDIAITKRRAFQDEDYWGGPVPNLGPDRVSSRVGVPLLIVGLAPGAHGANRTGRMFTGDRSGDWLFRAMHKAGFVNQAESSHAQDGLKLNRCVVTNICRCAPPDNKPTPHEVSNCQPFFRRTIEICKPTVFLALGSLAWKGVVRYAEQAEWIGRPQPKFGHGEVVSLGNDRFMVGSYHPSQQNTFTGRLTETMLDQVFSTAKKLIRQTDQ